MMMRFRLVPVLFVFLFLLGQICEVTGKRTHTPSYVFDNHPSGGLAVNPARATNASIAHLLGVNGRTQAGKRLSVAVIDSEINFALPHMQALKNKGLIHPAALVPDNPFLINPDEDFDKYKSTIQRLEAEHLDIISKEFAYPTPSPEELTSLRLQKELINKNLTDYWSKDSFLQGRKRSLEQYNAPGAENHGSGVIHALHKTAPELMIFPIDRVAAIGNGKTNSELLTEAIQIATMNNVDCINLSMKLTSLDDEGLEALAAAVRKGILIVTSAGNDGYPGLMSYMGNYDKRKHQLFEKLNGQGILFAGATQISSSNGEEEVTYYSQHPEEEKRRNCVHIVGEDLNIQACKDPNKLVGGTSFAAPIVAGLAALVKQYGLDRNYNMTPENLCQILYHSGDDITYMKPWSLENIIYKSPDAWKACQYAEEMFNPKPAPTPPVSPPTPPVSPPTPPVSPPTPPVSPPTPPVSLPISPVSLYKPTVSTTGKKTKSVRVKSSKQKASKAKTKVKPTKTKAISKTKVKPTRKKTTKTKVVRAPKKKNMKKKPATRSTTRRSGRNKAIAKKRNTTIQKATIKKKQKK